jgi:glucose-1-phosphate cytidylyltransferase
MPPTRRKHFGPCKVVILAGGFGTRLAEQTDELPKPMVQVGGKPMLWHILKIYSHHGFNDFLIACGYKSEVIKRFFLEYRDQMSDLTIDFGGNSIDRIGGAIEPWRISLLDTGVETMTGGRIKRLAKHLGRGTFLMTYGDGVADVDVQALLEFHHRHRKLVTLTVVPRPEQFGAPTLKGDQVVRFAEKQRVADDWINAGFFALEPGVMKYIEDDRTNFELQSLRQIAQDGQLMAYRHRGFWQPMDTLRDVRQLNSMWMKSEAPWRVWT